MTPSEPQIVAPGEVISEKPSWLSYRLTRVSVAAIAFLGAGTMAQAVLGMTSWIVVTVAFAAGVAVTVRAVRAGRIRATTRAGSANTTAAAFGAALGVALANLPDPYGNWGYLIFGVVFALMAGALFGLALGPLANARVEV